MMREQRYDFRNQGVTKALGEVSRESREKLSGTREKLSGTRETQNPGRSFPGEQRKAFRNQRNTKPLGEVSRESREKFQEIFNIRKRVTVNALYQ